MLGDAALCAIQHQWCIKFRVLRAEDFYTLLALNGKKEHLPALEMYKNQSPIFFWGVANKAALKVTDLR